MRNIDEKNSRNWLYTLALINLICGVCALVYDWEKLARIPIAELFFVPICPLFPTLTAVVYMLILAGKRQTTWASFTVLGLIMYSIMNLLFYPTYMLLHGFSWLILGNMVFVGLYTLQGYWLIPYTKKLTLPLIVPIVFWYLVKIWLDGVYGRFTYLVIEGFPLSIHALLFAALLTSFIFAFFLIQRIIVLRKVASSQGNR